MRYGASYKYKSFLNAQSEATAHRHRQNETLRESLPWQSVATAPQRVFVHTVVRKDEANSQVLTLMQKGRFWFDENGHARTDVPTHWAPLATPAKS